MPKFFGKLTLRRRFSARDRFGSDSRSSTAARAAGDRSRRAIFDAESPTSHLRPVRCGWPNLPPSSFRRQSPAPANAPATDVVAVDAVLLPNNHRAVFSPPVTLRCPMAEAVAQWITNDVAPTIGALGTSLRSIETLNSFDCRPRNGITGAPVSEHGRANALDVRSFKLANGIVVELTSASVTKSLREKLRESACARFSTVLGNGADAYHEAHVHIDMMERSKHYKICQWDVLDPAQTAALAAKKAAAAAARIPAVMTAASDIPLPLPRPVIDSHAANLSQQSVPRSFKEGTMRTPVALSVAASLAASAMAYAEEQTVTVGPWTIADFLQR